MAKRKQSRRKGASRKSTPIAVQAPPKVDFASEYHYVIGDLKRLGTLAAAMFAAMVILALIIR